MLTEEIIRAEMRLREWEAMQLGREREAMMLLKQEAPPARERFSWFRLPGFLQHRAAPLQVRAS